MSAEHGETVEFDLIMRVRFTEVIDVEQLKVEVDEIARQIDWDCGDGNASWDAYRYQWNLSSPRIVS